MKSFSEFMTEAAFLMRKTGENLVTQKNKSGRPGLRDRVEAKDAVKQISKHVDHKPLNDEIEAIASDKPNSDVRNVIKHHLRKAGLTNTHLL